MFRTSRIKSVAGTISDFFTKYLMNENMLIAIIQHLKEFQFDPEKKFQASTGFEPTTFAIIGANALPLSYKAR